MSCPGFEMKMVAGGGAREREAQLAREGAFAAKAQTLPEQVEQKSSVQPKAKSLVRMGTRRQAP